MLFWKSKKKIIKSKSPQKTQKQLDKLNKTTDYLKLVQYSKLRKKGQKALDAKFTKAEQKYYERKLINHNNKQELTALRSINKTIDKSQKSIAKRKDLNDNIKIMVKYSQKKPKKTAELFKALLILPTKK